MPKAVTQGVTLAEFCYILALYNFGASSPGNSCSIVRAIVRDHKQPIAWKQLTENICEC
jgi:hypothetical protein